MLSCTNGCQRIDCICGDLDSIDPETLQYYQERGADIHKDTDQYSTDFTKALREADSRDTVQIAVFGGLDGRADQAFAQLHQLYTAQSGQRELYLITIDSIIMLLHRGMNVVEAPVESDMFSKHVGLVPLGQSVTVSTVGLEWDLDAESLEFGRYISTSNHIQRPQVTVDVSSALLFTVSFAVPYHDSR